MKLTNRKVLVTGANRGIGRALVQALLAEGVAKVYAAARDPQAITFDDARVVPVRLDVTDAEQVAAAARLADDVDLLINNAGTAAFASVLDAPFEALAGDLEVNYYGTLRVMREFLPALERAQGEAAIVNVVTIAAFVNFPGLGGYSASKAALFSATQGIRMQLAPKGISVHTVNPGPIDTDMAKDLTMDKTSPEEAARNIVAGLKGDQAEIFPDPAAQQMFEVWNGDYRELERMVADMSAED